jgi:hypothetical protein
VRTKTGGTVCRFRALENLTGVDADLTIGVGKIGSVAHQAAGGGELAHSVNCRHRVAGRQRHDLSALASEKRVDADNERAGAQLDQVHDRAACA